MTGPTLTATLEAKLDQYKQQMSDAVDTASDAVSKIESAFSKSNVGSTAFAGGLLGSLLGSSDLSKLLTSILNINKAMEDLENSAKLVGLTIEGFQADQFAAAIKGLSSADFTKGVTEMATRLNDATRGTNDLTKLLDANNQKYKDQNGQIIGINQALQIGGDLIQNAATELDKIKIADMLGLSKEWIPVLEQGGDAFKKLADSAGAAGAIIDSQTVQKAAQFQREWDASAAQWKATMSATLAGFLPMLDQLIDKAAKFAQTSGIGQAAKDSFNNVAGQSDDIATKFNNLYQSLKNVDAGTGTTTQTFAALKDLLIGSDSWIQFGNQAAAQADVATAAAARVKQVFDQLAGTVQKSAISTGDAFDKSGARTVIPKDKDDDGTSAFDRETDRLNRHIAQLDADSVAVGQNAGTQEKLKAELILLNGAAKDNDAITVDQIDNYTKFRASMDANAALAAAGIKLTTDQAQAFDQVTQRAQAAAQATAVAKQQFASANQALQFGGDQFISALDGIRTGSLTAAQAVSQLTNALITALEKAILLGQGPLAGVLGFGAAPGSGGTGGLLGNLFGLSGAAKGVGASSDILEGPAALGLKTFASGTDSAPGGLAIVGEDGPELINLPKGASVTPNSALRQLGSQSSSSSSGPTVVIQNTNNFAAGINGTDMAAINQQIVESSHQTVAATISAIRSGVVNNPHFIQ